MTSACHCGSLLGTGTFPPFLRYSTTTWVRRSSALTQDRLTSPLTAPLHSLLRVRTAVLMVLSSRSAACTLSSRKRHSTLANLGAGGLSSVTSSLANVTHEPFQRM